MASSFRFDKHGLEKAIRKAGSPHMRETARKMERVLAGLAAECRGSPIPTVKSAVRRAFKTQGWDIRDPELTRYATAISEGTTISVRVKP